MSDLALWQDDSQLAQIKEQYGKLLTNQEFNLLVQIGRATGLNPFMREIWSVKYGNAPASIFIGRDGYRKSAQAHKGYQGHNVDAVYSNDIFDTTPSTGEVIHKYGKPERGALVGAYCIVHRKNCKPMYNYVEFKEYNTGKSLWQSKPSTMIKKVAEAQGLRGAFQELFAGTYEESEQWEDKNENTAPVTHEAKLEAINVPETPKNAPQVPSNLITDAQVKKFNTVWSEYYEIYKDDKVKNPNGLPKEGLRREMIQKGYKVDSLRKLTTGAASQAIEHLEKAVQRASKPQVHYIQTEPTESEIIEAENTAQANGDGF